MPGWGSRMHRHEHRHLARRVELAGALPLALGELPQQVLVGPAEDVGLHVVEAETIVGVVQDLNQSRESPVVDDPLPGSRGVEVGHVDHAREPRVLAGDGPDRVGQMLAQAGCLLDDGRPAGLLRDVEADELVILLDQLGRRLHVPELWARWATSSSKTSDSRLRKISGRM